MRFVLIVLFLLTGCSQALSQQDLLNSYALHAADKNRVSDYLEGEALDAALTSIDLLAELGLQQVGLARFENLEAHGQDIFVACLDVSEVSFRSESGEQIALENRKLRQNVTVWINGESKRIRRLEVGGEC